MQFIDEARIEVVAGKGGDGCVSFLRQRNRPKGGPDGGNGGRGGDVVFKVQAGLNTLVNYRFNRLFRAPNGKHGEGSQKTGANGKNMYLTVPQGTKVSNAVSGQMLGELIAQDAVLHIAKGGEPGRGNMVFASSTNRTPYQHTKGKPGEQLQLMLELQLLADIGLVGMPNAGKSSLIRQISSATPKVAKYPFTTLTPQLGLVRRHGREAVIADIPGLIADSSRGRGLGNRFLRHLNRTSVLWHVIDLAPDEGDPLHNYHVITRELACSQFAALSNKPCWLILNKTDLLECSEVALLQQKFLQLAEKTMPIYSVCAISGAGCEELAQAAVNQVHSYCTNQEQQP